MTQRFFSNTSTVGQLTSPVAGSATSLATSGLANLPTVPFTITVDRNTASEEICLVTAVVGSTLTVTRGYDGTAQTTHAAGAPIEHTAGAIEFTEASAHTNATTNVHGTSGSLVGTSGSQTVFGKTVVSPLLQASTSDGDAAVLFIPAGVSRNMLRGVDAGGVNRVIVDSGGNATVASLTSSGNATVSGALTVTGATTHTGAVTLNNGATVPTGKDITLTDAPGVGTDAVNKTYADALGTSAPTVSTIARRDSAGRLQVVSPAVAADVATKSYVDTTAAGVIFDSGWVTATLGAPATVGPSGARYRKCAGVVTVHFESSYSGAYNANFVFFNLPAIYRPKQAMWPVVNAYGNTPVYLFVNTNGDVAMATTQTLAGILADFTYLSA